MNTIYFICSPSLGILDNWLPVIYKLRNKYPDARFICVITKSGTAELIDLNNILIKISDKLFDSVIYKSNSGCWFESNSFPDVKNANTPFFFEKFLLLFQRICLRNKMLVLLLNPINLFYRLHDFLSPPKKIFLNKLNKKKSIVLYDIYEETKEYNRELLSNFLGVPKFSINHGINIEQKPLEAKRIANLKCTPHEIKAFLFSKGEVIQYKDSYLLKDSDISIVGVPRHNKEWILYLHSLYDREANQDRDNYIFVISRSLCEYFTLERKIQAINDIKKLAFEDLNLRIVVKLHPKEQNHGLYEDILGKNAYGIQWIYSNEHPFILGSRCAFSISFFSGVVIDMAALKVPAIELLDLRGLGKFDNANSLRDNRGEPVLDYRYMDIVLGASNYSQLKTHANYVINNRTEVVNKFYKKYCELFPNPDKSVSLVVDQITKHSLN